MGVIERYRKQEGLSLEQLAGRVGDVTPTSLSRIDRGLQQPSAALLRRLHKASGGALTPNIVLGVEEPPPGLLAEGAAA